MELCNFSIMALFRAIFVHDLSFPVTLLNLLGFHLKTVSETTLTYFPIYAYPPHPKINHFLTFAAYHTYCPPAEQHHCSYHYDNPILLTYKTHWFVLAWLLLFDYLDFEIRIQ
jgi:hypothetical protein